MNIIEIPNGRLGNGIFRYLAGVILRMEYGAIRLYKLCEGKNRLIINDGNYNNFLNNIQYNNDVFLNSIIILDGYFQFDIYSKYRIKIIEFLKSHPDDIIYGTNLKHQLIQNKVKELMVSNLEKNRKYDIVIHIRLEDFLNTNNIIHPNTLISIINEIYNKNPTGTAAIVCNKLTTEIENNYIKYIYDNSKLKFNFMFESNDIITDFQIMKNTQNILVCSLSTLSWAAALLSETVKTVYLPKNKSNIHQTFMFPIKNTILYDNIFCEKKDLEELWSIPDSL